MITLESAESIRPFVQKDHDRIYRDDVNMVYAALDGADGPELSEAMRQALPGLIAKYAVMRHSQTDFLAAMASELDRLPASLIRQAAGALVCLNEFGSSIEIAFM